MGLRTLERSLGVIALLAAVWMSLEARHYRAELLAHAERCSDFMANAVATVEKFKPENHAVLQKAIEDLEGGRADDALALLRAYSRKPQPVPPGETGYAMRYSEGKLVGLQITQLGTNWRYAAEIPVGFVVVQVDDRKVDSGEAAPKVLDLLLRGAPRTARVIDREGRERVVSLVATE